MATGQAPEAAAKASVFEDFIDIFTSPAKVFARRVKANPMVPWLVVSVVVIALFFASRNVLASMFDAEMQRGIDAAMKANPNLTAEQMEKGRPMMNMVVTGGAVIGIPCILLILGLVTWLVGKMMGATLTYSTALLIAAYSWMPRIVEALLNLGQGLLLDASKLTSHFQLGLGVGRFMDPHAPTQGLTQFLARIDVFTLWVTFLLVTGLINAGKLDKSKALPTGVILWFVGAIPSLWALATGK
jgi:hypothetical protein